MDNERTLDLKTATAVTSVAATDRLLLDNGTELKPVSFETLMKAVSNNLKIGGRNLLKGTAGLVVNTSSDKWLTSKCVLTEEELVRSCPLVMSAKYKKTGTPSRNFGIGAIASTSNWYDHATISASDASDEGTITKVFGINPDRNKFSLFVQGAAGVEIYDIKLERGNVATDWTPAPEDLLAQSGRGNILSFKTLRYCLGSQAERRAA